MGFLSDLSGQTGARMAREARMDALSRENNNRTTVGNAYDTAQNFGYEGVTAWDPVRADASRYGAAGDVLLSGLGVTDPALARGAFQAGPGYEFARDQGLDAAARRANSLGMAASGNTLAELTRLGTGYANQEYGNWLTRLQGLAGMGMGANAQAAAGRAGGYNTLGQLAVGRGRDLVGVSNTAGQAVTNAMGQEAGALGAGAGNLAALGIAGANLLAGGLGGGMGGGLGGLGKLAGQFMGGMGGGGRGGGGYAGYGGGGGWDNLGGWPA